jgi:hypothetical protein
MEKIKKLKKLSMKKIFLSAVLVASSYVLFAQDTTNRTNNTMNNTNSTNTTNQSMSTNDNQSNTSTWNQNQSTSNYSAYGIPNYVQTNFQTQHPNVTNLTWTAPTANWYHGYYSDANGRYTHVYYSTDPYYNSQYYPERVMGYTVSLPVLQTYVPDAVITTATNLYKQNLYDITAMKGNNNQDIYEVRVMDNGELKSMWMDANGTAVTDYYRTDEQMNMNNTSNVNTATSTDTNAAMNSTNTSTNTTNDNTKMKTKTKMDDGSMIKTKTKNGKTRTKTSNSNNNDQY